MTRKQTEVINSALEAFRRHIEKLVDAGIVRFKIGFEIDMRPEDGGNCSVLLPSPKEAFKTVYGDDPASAESESGRGQ